MPTTVTKTVGPGKDYASLALAITGEARNLVSADEICELVLYAMTDGAAFVSGFTTDATRYVRIRVNPADRHDGTRSPSAYRIHVNLDFNEALNITSNYTRVEGLQITNDPTNGHGILIAGTNVRLIDTLVYDCGGRGIAGAVNHHVIMNNVAVMNCGQYGIGRTGALDGFTFCNNCTVVGCGGAGFVGYTAFGNATTLKNCYSGGNSGDDYDDANGITLTTCFSEDGSASSTVAAYSINHGARFLNVTDGSEDVHHTGSSSLRHAGTNLDLDASWIHPDGFVDIDGDARDPDWDVGVDQSPPDAVPNLLPPTVAGRAFTGETLTATGGTWTGAISTTGRWQRETGVGTEIYEDIVGETSLTYVVQDVDVRLRLRYVETATNVSGSTSVPSDPTDAAGTTAAFDAELELEVATIFAINLPTYVYVPVRDDVGRRLIFVETATNDAGSTEAEALPFGPIGFATSFTVGFEVQTDITAELGPLPDSPAASAAFMVLLFK